MHTLTSVASASQNSGIQLEFLPFQPRYSDEKAVRLSVCPSVKCVNCDKTEERSVQILYHMKDHLA